MKIHKIHKITIKDPVLGIMEDWEVVVYQDNSCKVRHPLLPIKKPEGVK